MAATRPSVSFMLIVHLTCVTLAAARPGWVDWIAPQAAVTSEVLTPAADFDGAVVARQIKLEEMGKDELDRLIMEGQKKLDTKKMDDVKSMVNVTDEPHNSTSGMNATSVNMTSTTSDAVGSTTMVSSSAATTRSSISTMSTPVASSTVLSTTRSSSSGSPLTSTTPKDDRVNEPLDVELLHFADQADEPDVAPKNATTARVTSSTTPAPQSSSTTVRPVTSTTPSSGSSPLPKNITGSGASQLYASLAICLALALIAVTTC